MSTEDTNKDERFEKFEDLLEEYWNLAYNEGKNKRVKGTGETLRELHEVFSNSQSCQECEKLKAELDLTKTLAQQSNQDHLNARLDYQGEIIGLKAERDELAAQVTHWKANHASVVEQARILKERPDMPIERVKAYENWVAMAAQVEKMRATLEAISMSSLTHQRIRDYVEKALALPELSSSVLNRVRADALDAKRYRWLCSSSVGPAQIWELLSDDCNPPVMTLKSMDDLDAAIDRALAALWARKC